MHNSKKFWIGVLIGIAVLGFLGYQAVFYTKWEKNISTTTKLLFTVDVGDGTKLVARNFHQYLKGVAGGWPEYKDRIQKQDVFRIDANNNVLWQTAYITNSTYTKTEPGYDHAKYANLIVPYHEVRVEIPDLNVYGFSTVRRCSPTVYQFATRLLGGGVSASTDDPAAKMPGAILREPGMQIEIDSGSATTFTKVSDLCSTVIYDGIQESACNPFEIAVDEQGLKKIQYTSKCPVGYLYNNQDFSLAQIQTLPVGEIVVPH